MMHVIDNTMIIDDNGDVHAIETKYSTQNRGKAIYSLLKQHVPDVSPHSQVYSDNGNLLNINSESIIFVHCGNQDRVIEFIKKYINRCYIICYSGDTTPSADLQLIMFNNPDSSVFDNLPPSIIQAEVSRKWDIPSFVDAVTSKTPGFLNYIKKSGKPYLSALSILCVGFLVQHKFEGFATSYEINVAGDELNKTEIWRKVLGASKEDAKANLELGSDHHDIEALLDDLIYKNESSDGSVIYKEFLISSDADKVNTAYKQIALQ